MTPATAPDALPAGPGWPLWQTLRCLLDPVGFHQRHARRFGDLFSVRIAGRNTVLIGHPDGARDLFSADPDQFTVYQPEGLTALTGEHALLVLTGQAHRRHRKLLTPPFHGERLRACGRIMIAETLREVRRWPRAQAFDVLRSTQAISLAVIIRAIFGVVDDLDAARIASAAQRYMAPGLLLPLFLPFLQRNLWGLSPWPRFLRVRRELLDLLQAQIDRRRREPGEDLLSLMLASRDEQGGALSDDEVRDELVTLLLAGHETAAVAMAWALYFLHRTPEVLHRLLAEIAELPADAAPAHIAALPYLEAVCHETLRRQPILVEVPRQLSRPLRVMGREIPAGVTVSASAVLIHGREDLYPEPRRFYPERFLSRRYSPAEFLAFGGGARRCIGATFALYEMKLVLFTILRSCKLRLKSARPIAPTQRGVTMGPKGGVAMVQADEGKVISSSFAPYPPSSSRRQIGAK